MAFKRKKIGGAETVGSKLQAERRKRKLTLENVEEATKVRIKYLKAIEAGSWNEFPSKVYVYGIVKRYATFLEMDSEKVLSDFRAEFGSSRLSFLSKKNSSVMDKIVITPKFLIIAFVSILVCVLLGYIFISAEKVSRPPEIEIIAPKEEVTKQSELSIEGKTSNTAIVEINGQLVSVDDKGYFKQKTTLNEGVNLFEITAKSRMGKEATKQIRILKTNL
jgi:cytoskeletal protein RodZ